MQEVEASPMPATKDMTVTFITAVNAKCNLEFLYRLG